MLYIKVALLGALFVAAPVILFHVWRFIRPGLYSRERYYALGFIVSGTLLFSAGGAFAYYVAFPFAVEFLLGVGHDFTPAITGPSYLSFLMTVIVGLALMFELPLVIVFLARMGVVTPRFLLRNFRWAVLIIFVAAAIITPTSDVFNLCLFAVPTLGLYLLGVAAAALVGRAQARARAREQQETEEEEEGEAAWS
jgi:sec-independent protein translocase protein TatC